MTEQNSLRYWQNQQVKAQRQINEANTNIEKNQAKSNLRAAKRKVDEILRSSVNS